jgi:hypothetical protein
MATYPVLTLARVYLTDRAKLREKFPHPVFVYEPPRAVGEAIEITDVKDLAPDSDALDRGEPVAIEIVKGVVPNAFPFGVTIGHAENNDIVLRHPQVSRFHAYVQNANRKRYLVDADSKNGTWIDGQMLTPSRPAELPAFAALRFGRFEVTYVAPEKLGEWLDRRMESAPPG